MLIVVSNSSSAVVCSDEDRDAPSRSNLLLFLLPCLVLELDSKEAELLPHLFHVFLFLTIQDKEEALQLRKTKRIPLSAKNIQS